MAGLGLSYIITISEEGKFYLCTWDTLIFKELGKKLKTKTIFKK